MSGKRWEDVGVKGRGEADGTGEGKEVDEGLGVGWWGLVKLDLKRNPPASAVWYEVREPCAIRRCGGSGHCVRHRRVGVAELGLDKRSARLFGGGVSCP